MLYKGCGKVKESVLKDLLKNEDKIGTSRHLRYLSAEKDFPIGEPQNLRIVRGTASRVRWGDGEVKCRSDDGITGLLQGSSNTDIPCAECKYLNGFEEHGTRVYCSRRCDLFATIGDSPIEYKFSIPERAQMNLTRYVSGLLKLGFDIPDVITEVTRIKDSDGYPNYLFALSDEEVGEPQSIEEFSADEKQVALNLRDMYRAEGEQVDIEYFASMLEYTPGLNSISPERAMALAELISINGVIK